MADEIRATTAEMLRRMQAGWDTFQAYLKTLTREQMTQPTDAGGWTVKDHIAHLAVWEDGIDAQLSGDSRQARMGVDDATWQSDWKADDYFRINDVIYREHRDKPLEEVLAMLEAAHARLVQTVSGMQDDDLNRPYREIDSRSRSETPVYAFIVGNSYGHYEEHRPWIEAIATQAGS